MRGELYFRVLGPVVAERDGSALSLGGPQARGVLAMLLLRANGVVSVDELSAMLWGDTPPASHRVQIQGIVSSLRRALGGDESAKIITQPPGYRLRIASQRLDLDEFRHEVTEARRLLRAQTFGMAAELLRHALSWWRGPACADLAYEPIRNSAAALDELRTTALEHRIDADIELASADNKGDELVAELTALAREHPLRERFRTQLMTVLARAGRPEDALAVYQNAREALVEELGLEPSEEMREVQRAILTGDIGAATRHQAATMPRQLPPGPSTLIGRDDVLTAISELWQEAESAGQPPCVAITGPGGTGKTAVALRVAHTLAEHYPDGQLFVRLEARREPGETVVIPQFLHALGVPPGDVPADPGERAALFRTLIAPRRVLIVLDDVTDERQVRPVIPAAADCALVVTSRRRLDGIENLRTISLGVLLSDASVGVLREIAGADRVDTDPHASKDVARHCGGLPLALRIAAARLAARPNWTVRDLARRLEDARERLDWLHLGDLDVRASIAETYSGLSANKQRLFRMLGHLGTEPFPSWLAGALLGDPSGGAERVLDDLAEVHLVEPASMGVTGPSYQMHDLVRLVARELALEADTAAERRDAVRRAWHGWLSLTVVADSAFPHWVGLDPEPAPQWHPSESTRETVRGAAWDWFGEAWPVLEATVREAADQQVSDVAWPLAQRLSAYLELRGWYDKWAGVLAHGLRAAEAAGDPQGQATMLGLSFHAAANRDEYLESLQFGERTFAAYQALPSKAQVAETVSGPASASPAQERHEQALVLARLGDDPLAVAFAAARLVQAMRASGRHGDYLSLFEEAQHGFRDGGAPLLEAWAIKYTGLAYCRMRRFAEAAECLARVRAILADLAGEEADAYAGRDLAGFAAAYGRHEAEEMALEGLAQARANGDLWSTGRGLVTLGEVARTRGDHTAALTSYQDALAIWRDLNVPDKINQVLSAIEEVRTRASAASMPGASTRA